MDPNASEFFPRQDVPMGEAVVIENDDVIGAAATAEAIAQYDLSELSAKQIRKLSNYGAILDQLSPDQIAAVLEENEYSPDGRSLVILPKKKANPPAKTVRYTLDPNGKKIYR